MSTYQVTVQMEIEADAPLSRSQLLGDLKNVVPRLTERGWRRSTTFSSAEGRIPASGM